MAHVIGGRPDRAIMALLARRELYLAPSDPERARLGRALDLEPGEFQRALGPMIATLFWERAG